MNNINNFVAAGDFVTKSAPESVGMAWYAVKLTLTAIHSNYDLYTFFGSGLSDISEIMILVRHYDQLYDERSEPNWKPSPVVEKLFQDVIGAYEAVLDFSFAIKRHLTTGALTRIKHGFKDFFGMSKVKFEDKLNTVAALKKKILEESQAAFQDKTLTQLQDVTALLAGIEGTVRHLSDLQEIQHKLRDEANAKFDFMLKGFDDIKASTKRKTQWDYAVGDFQAFHEALSPLEGSFSILGDTIDAIYPGTCQWVFDERVYREWEDSDNNAMLCVTGPEGCGKSYIVAAIADRFTQDADCDKALFCVSCNASAGSSAGLSNSQSYTSDSICRTFLAQLYELAPQGEENVDSGTYVDVGLGYWDDMQLVITDALKDIPDLTAAEQQEAKDAILAKASSSFLEPFQRPLSKRLEALPNGTNDAYAKALRNMSPNYIELLRTAVTWCLLSPGIPWCPCAREVMDAFHGTYDITPDPDTLKEAGEEPGFPSISPLELEQLRTTTDPFLTVFRAGDRDHWVFEADHQAAVAFFCKGTETPWEEEIEEHLCARCRSSATAPKITVDPKQGHLQMALTCLRHLNNPLFQKMAGYIAIDKKETETAAYNTVDFEPFDSDAREETQCGRLETSDPDS
ncbi:hypothetical protein N656DRAFT_831090 [Canariomyces notabilis]|uniref:Nephrocystin 3-like N-terminal domain-containing protein n=1 Tax=Canariomyces notabilis TaxID=2074819 RepID=A0AAN6QH50_9PEZI|nr:hypothetical protein N656DRAFT_831090 [Canariomyces arenarius]